MLAGMTLILVAAVAWFPVSLGFAVVVFGSPFLLDTAFPNFNFRPWPWLFAVCWGSQLVAFVCAWVWARRAWDRYSVGYAFAFVVVVLALLGFYYFIATHGGFGPLQT